MERIGGFMISSENFLDRWHWYSEHKSRDDLELHIFKKDNEAAINRLYERYKDWSAKVRSPLEDKGEYLSLTSNVINCLGNYEYYLISKLIQSLEPEKDKYTFYSTRCTASICVYMQKCYNNENTDVPNRLLPVDPKQFSIYEDIVASILESCKRYEFDGLHCEYSVVGNDRYSRCLFIEDSVDRSDGGRDQTNFRISLYQMPGIYHGTVEGKEIKNVENGESYALDCIIAGGDKSDSFDDFSEWIDAYILGFEID